MKKLFFFLVIILFACQEQKPVVITNIKIVKTKADIIKALSDTVDNYIARLKTELIEKTGGFDEKNIPIGKSDQEFGYKYLCENKRGEQLVKLINEFSVVVSEETRNEGREDLALKNIRLLDTSDTPDPLNLNEKVGFIPRVSKGLPLAAVLANLTMYQMHIKNAEADVIMLLVKRIGG